MDEPQRVCSKCGASYDPEVIFCPKDGTPLGVKKTEIAEDPYVGLSIGGQFHVERLIGIGAMGRVYLAHQKGIERGVAIKVLHRELIRNPNVITRFHREAKVASRLVHPNVVQVLMTGELERQGVDIGGEAYLVMEYLDGISLRSALAAAGGSLPLPRALHVILQVCDAVGEAHSQGIVHRDLKPENVMLVRRGDDRDFVKVLDFGVARLDWADSSVATQAGVIFGTARYISPEGAQGSRVEPSSDVYSISTMLFQCLSGETPFDGDNPVAILLKHTSAEPPDVRSITRSSYVPEPIAKVINANLAKKPSDRCRDARELGRALVEAARQSGMSPGDLMVRSTLLSDSGALTLASIERTKQMDLSPDLAKKLAGKTAVVDPPNTDHGAPEDPSAVSAPPPQEAESASRAAPDAKATALVDAPPSRPSGVEPTMVDEPAEELFSRPSAEPPDSKPAPRGATRSAAETLAPVSEPRISFPAHDAPAGLPNAAQRYRRLLMIAGFFVLGAILTLAVAHRLGAFETPEPGVDSYVERANVAIAKSAWTTPADENVRDITDSALQRWPGSSKILAVRARAANVLTQRAQLAMNDDAAAALRFAKLARELDPKNDEARMLVGRLSVEATPDAGADDAVTPAGSASAGKLGRPSRPSKKTRPAAPASSSAAPPASASPPDPTPAASTTGGGRWL